MINGHSDHSSLSKGLEGEKSGIVVQLEQRGSEGQSRREVEKVGWPISVEVQIKLIIIKRSQSAGP